jgi:hypothetical protein
LGKIIIIGDVFKIAVKYSSILFYNGVPSTPIDFYEQANHIRGPQTNLTVSRKAFKNFKKYIGAEAINHWQLYKENGEPQLSFEKAHGQWEHIFKCRLESWQ